MVGWRVPPREELLPINDQQSCAICAADQWQYVYLQLSAPAWVQELPWFTNWFICLCSPCHDALQAHDDAALTQKYNASEYRGGSAPDAAEFLRVLRVRLSEPPLTRSEAQGRC